ncbi:MAG: HelD family protein [Actinomycetes bacterium]
MASAEVQAEQVRLDVLYRRLDELRVQTVRDLDRAARQPSTGTPAGRAEREALRASQARRLARLDAAEDRLCFGRIDLVDAGSRAIGRIGLSDGDQHPILVDWRAPAAEAFYQATPAAPDGVLRRRHLATQGRRVVGVEDELLDVDAVDERTAGTLTGEGALMAALDARRTGQMKDIVATLQAEQDRVVRAPLSGVLVVQGGPGTGKTAVALHRAAYLLYTYRDRLSRTGVLVIGPNSVFLRYIESVLPSLGESAVVLARPGDLLPGVRGECSEPAEVTAIKGDARMVGVLSTAVRRRQRLLPGPRTLRVEAARIVLHPRDVAGARSQARRSGKPHNLARVDFVREVLARLAGRLAHATGTELTDETRPELLAALRDSRDVRREVNLAWMPLSAEQVLTRLFTDPAELAAVSPTLSAAERRLLHREPADGWSAADVALLDELAGLLGEDDTASKAQEARARAEQAAEQAYARGVLTMAGPAAAMMTPELLAQRYGSDGETWRGTLAERAAADREWTYGHVVVDEAQELSAMDWRMVMRRCPGRSMTIVGDLAQTGALGGADSWGQVLDPFVPGRWRLAELTVNYRTPRQVMEFATRLLDGTAAADHAPASVRDSRWPPEARHIQSDDLVAVARTVADELEHLATGRLAVITPRTWHPRVAAAVPQQVGTAESVMVLTPETAKGLEFDTVVLLEPAEILEESVRGAHDLYVALTRCTQRLVVLHSGALPAALAGLALRPG